MLANHKGDAHCRSDFMNTRTQFIGHEAMGLGVI